MSGSFTIGTLEDERVRGLDAPGLAVAVSRAVYEHTDVAFVASARGGAEGIVACSAAASADAPLLLAEADALPASTALELRRLGVTAVVLVGDETRVSAVVERALLDLGVSVTRLTAADDSFVDIATRVREDALLGSDRFARTVALAVASFPPSTAVYVCADRYGVVLHAPDAAPVPGASAIDALSPSVVAVFEES